MAKNLSQAANDDMDDDVFEEDEGGTSSLFDDGPAWGGRDNSIRRRIEERLERRRLIDELGMIEDELDF